MRAQGGRVRLVRHVSSSSGSLQCGRGEWREEGVRRGVDTRGGDLLSGRTGPATAGKVRRRRSHDSCCCGLQLPLLLLKQEELFLKLPLLLLELLDWRAIGRGEVLLAECYSRTAGESGLIVWGGVS